MATKASAGSEPGAKRRVARPAVTVPPRAAVTRTDPAGGSGAVAGTCGAVLPGRSMTSTGALVARMIVRVEPGPAVAGARSSTVVGRLMTVTAAEPVGAVDVDDSTAGGPRPAWRSRSSSDCSVPATRTRLGRMARTTEAEGAGVAPLPLPPEPAPEPPPLMATRSTGPPARTGRAGRSTLADPRTIVAATDDSGSVEGATVGSAVDPARPAPVARVSVNRRRVRRAVSVVVAAEVVPRPGARELVRESPVARIDRAPPVVTARPEEARTSWVARVSATSEAADAAAASWSAVSRRSPGRTSAVPVPSRAPVRTVASTTARPGPVPRVASALLRSVDPAARVRSSVPVRAAPSRSAARVSASTTTTVSDPAEPSAR